VWGGTVPGELSPKASLEAGARYCVATFGQEATSTSQDSEWMKFTGQERDLRDPSNTTDDLDDMHARYDNPNLGRFLSTDPVRGNPASPQSWNLYAYVGNNPLNRTDPTGQAAADLAQQADRVMDNLAQMVDKTASGDLVGILEMALTNTVVTLAKGTTDLLKVGDATGEAIGEGATKEDVVVAASKDAGRAGGLILIMAGGAQAAERALATRVEAAVGPPASVPVGRLGSEMSVPSGTNQPAVVAGRTYTGHALDQMQGRGIVPSVVDDTIRRGAVAAGRGGATIHTTEQLRVVVSSDGRVITVMPQ
jgi:RHS repeat-associated protein